MKRILLTAALFLTVCFSTMSNPLVAEGKSNTTFGDYKIVALEDHMMLNGKELDKYLISYDNPERKVIVAVDKQKNCKKYYVISGPVAVQYECNGTYFGIRKLDKLFVDKGLSTSLEVMNKEAFYSQRMLVSGTTNTVDHLTLIASYFPGLFDEVVS
jgi:hypothetical protein